MSDRLRDRVAIVTGGGTGIGAATARRFAEEGARVVICGRRAELLDTVVEDIARAGGKARAVSLDLAERENVERLIRETASSEGRLDVLVNNAVQMVVKPIVSMDPEEWRKSLGVALDSVFWALRVALPVMAEQGRGAVVNISSLAAHMGDVGLGGYCAAKAGLEALTRAAAVEAAPDGVRVNALCLGMIATEKGELAYPDDEARAAMEAKIPLGRFGIPREIANCALFLASDEASFVTGATLISDGGQSAGLGSPRLREGHRQ